MRHFELPENTKKVSFFPNSAFLLQKLGIITFQGVESNKQWWKEMVDGKEVSDEFTSIKPLLVSRAQMIR